MVTGDGLGTGAAVGELGTREALHAVPNNKLPIKASFLLCDICELNPICCSAIFKDYFKGF